MSELFFMKRLKAELLFSILANPPDSMSGSTLAPPQSTVTTTQGPSHGKYQKCCLVSVYTLSAFLKNIKIFV